MPEGGELVKGLDRCGQAEDHVSHAVTVRERKGKQPAGSDVNASEAIVRRVLITHEDTEADEISDDR